jgi:hypothetical protein
LASLRLIWSRRLAFWLRAWWGVMAFLAAAVAQIVMYTFCSATFGNHPGLVGFHLATIAIC